MRLEPLVTINILSFNRREVLKYTLSKVFELEYKNFEVIVVDNASNDGTSNMVINEYPNVKLIQLPKNIGISGYNVGFQRAQGEFILLLDDDSYPKTNILNEALKLFENDNALGIVAFNIMNEEESKSETYYFKEYPISFMGGGSLVSKKLILKIGGYDENFFLYHNELDYAARCWDAGYKIYYLKNAIVIHLQSKVARDATKENILHGRKRYYYFFLSYSKFVVLRLDGSLRLKTIIKWLINRSVIMIRFGYVKEYFSALFQFFKDISKLKQQSKPINKILQSNYGLASFPFIDRDFFPAFTKPKLLKLKRNT